MQLLAGKSVLVTGVLTESSIAFHCARLAQEQGAQLVLSSFGPARRLTAAVARRLPETAAVIDLDVTNPDDLHRLSDRIGEHVERLDGVVHAIAGAPPNAFDFLSAEWADVAAAMQVSAFSLQALAVACLPRLSAGAGIVGLTFDSRTTWPGYDWMGVAKAAFEATSRYCARDLGPRGIRCNLVSAGPLRTPAARAIPGERDNHGWALRAPLGWDDQDPSAVAKACVALLSEWFPATTGEIIHVDGGAHAVGP